MSDRLGEDFALVQIDKLYRCKDQAVVPEGGPIFVPQATLAGTARWGFEVLLYDLTRTYFESDPPEEDKRRCGYSRDQRPDCVQVVIALIVTPQGFPLAYKIRAGNTSDKTTLADFLKKIEKHYGEAHRTWVMAEGYRLKRP